MAIYEITQDQLRKIDETTFETAGIREREDLQRLLRSQIEVIAPDTLVLTEEFCDWEDSRRRIDLLALDKDATLVVIELKRTEDGGHMELQAIRYAAMVSAMTFDKAVEAQADFLNRTGKEGDARNAILEFLGWEEPDEDGFAQDVRIVLASAEFNKELTTAVMWLNDHGLDVRCVRIKPYCDGGQTLVDVQQVIPLPEAADYQVQIREKVARERGARRGQSERSDRLHRFWTALLDEARRETDLHARISPSRDAWVGASAGRSGLDLNYVITQKGPRVELYIDTGDGAINKDIFDEMHAAKDAIESRYGAPLGWERLDDKRACRIKAEWPGDSARDETTWHETRTRMIEAMIRFEAAIRPSLDAISK